MLIVVAFAGTAIVFVALAMIAYLTYVADSGKNRSSHVDGDL